MECINLNLKIFAGFSLKWASLTFHTKTWRDRYSRCLQCNRKEFNGNVHSQSRNRSRKALKAWHVRDPWVTGALCAPQSPFAHLNHSIFEAFPPFARSIPASQTVAFTTRCHQRPWLGWQIELAARAHTHTYTILSWKLKQWRKWANKTCFTEINKKSTNSFTEAEWKQFFFLWLMVKSACQVECFANLVVYRPYLSVKKHSGKKKSGNLRQSVSINTSQSD